MKGEHSKSKEFESGEESKSEKSELEFGHFGVPVDGEVGRWTTSERRWLGMSALS